MGTPTAAVPSLKRLLEDGHDVLEVWTQPDRPSGRGRRLTASPVKEFALKNGIEVFQPERIKSRESRSRFASLNADAAIVVAYGRILTRTYLEAFRYGCINVHFSLLPKYRGAAPVNWAIASGETVTGVTTMKMDAGLDTGDILKIIETEISENENAIELMDRLSEIGAEVLSETLEEIARLEPKKQQEELATYAPLFSKEDGLIAWQMNSVDICNRIRGFQPFPKSYSFLNGERVTFWQAGVVDVETAGLPGTVLSAAGDELVIGCGGNTVLSVSELQIAGKARANVRDFLNGASIRVGDVFGDE